MRATAGGAQSLLVTLNSNINLVDTGYLIGEAICGLYHLIDPVVYFRSVVSEYTNE